MEWVTGEDAAKHLLVFVVFLTFTGGLVLGILRGWNAVLSEMRSIVNTHAADEKKWAEENEAHAASFREEVLVRLDRVESEVQTIREHLISEGKVPLATTPQKGWTLK